MTFGEEVAVDFFEDIIKGRRSKEIEKGEYIYNRGLIKEDPNLLILEKYLSEKGYKLIRISAPDEKEMFRFKLEKVRNNLAKNNKIAKICNENNKTHKIL